MVKIDFSKVKPTTRVGWIFTIIWAVLFTAFVTLLTMVLWGS